MKTLLTVAVTLLVPVLVPVLANAAIAQRAAPDTERPSPVAPPDSELLKRADDAFHAAKASCQEEGVPQRQVCIERARQAHAATVQEAGVTSLPAVQTQSSAVSATGVARAGTSERVHGSPAAMAE